MRFGGEWGKPQGYGQAAPQEWPYRQPGNPGGGPGYPGLGYGPGAGTGQEPGMSMSGGIPAGGGMVPGGVNPGSGMIPEGGGLPLGPSPGGSLRNQLGSGLKSRGVFQKDGKVNNQRGGFIGPKQRGGAMMGSGPFSFLGEGGGPAMSNQPRQFILEATQPGITANGIATISPDHVFSCMANLPAPNTFVGQGFGTYAVYLADQKGSTGFLAGVLRPVGNGVYQTQFRSQVPLSHYSRVVVSIENPQRLGHVPNGPIVLQVKQPTGPSRFLSPLKNVGGSIWQRISGFIPKGGKVPAAPLVPGEGVGAAEMMPPVGSVNPAMGEAAGTIPVAPPPSGQ